MDYVADCICPKDNNMPDETRAAVIPYVGYDAGQGYSLTKVDIILRTRPQKTEHNSLKKQTTVFTPLTNPKSRQRVNPSSFDMANQDKSIVALAETILEQTKGIANFLKDNNLAEPTFSIESSQPPSAPAFVELQGKLKTSLEDLQRLVEGPRRFLRSFCVLGYDLAAFQIALDFNFFTLVPADGEISLEDLSKLAGLDLDRVSRVVRMLATYRFFEEHKPGVIRHSSSSIVLLQDEELRCTVHYS